MTDDVNWLDLARGPYGEILPPSFVAWWEPEEVIAVLEAEAGIEIDDPDLAAVYLQNLLLRKVVAGELSDDEEAMALHRAVVQESEGLSLRPLGLEDLELDFAPVLTHLGDGHWQVGLPEYGAVMQFNATGPAEAVERAQAIYVEWCEAD